MIQWINDTYSSLHDASSDDLAFSIGIIADYQQNTQKESDQITYYAITCFIPEWTKYAGIMLKYFNSNQLEYSIGALEGLNIPDITSLWIKDASLFLQSFNSEDMVVQYNSKHEYESRAYERLS